MRIVWADCYHGCTVHEAVEFSGPSVDSAPKAIRVPPIRVSDIVRGKRAITVDTALGLSIYFGTTPELWLNVQAQWDLSLLTAARREDYALIPRMHSS